MVSASRVAASAVVAAAVAFGSAAANDYYAPVCYGEGERFIGETGYPAVDYKPCCEGLKPTKVDYHWGSFCGKPPAPIKCAGEELKPAVDYVECAEGYKCAKPDAAIYSWYDWGKYCLPSGGDSDDMCYKDGERQIGEDGYAAVTYMPCCNGYDAVDMYDSYGAKVWGKFCPYVYEKPTKAPETYYPRTTKPYYKPEPKPYYKPEPKTKGYYYPKPESSPEYDYEPEYDAKKCYDCDGYVISCAGYVPVCDDKKPKTTTAAVTTAAAPVAPVVTAAPASTSATAVALTTEVPMESAEEG